MNWKARLPTLKQETLQRVLQYDTPDADLMEWLRLADPDGLLALIKSKALQPEELTVALECLAETDLSYRRIVSALLPFLNHREILVREGALYGLLVFIDQDKRVRQAVEYLAEHEDVHVIRQTCQDVLDSESL